MKHRAHSVNKSVNEVYLKCN